MVRKQHKVLSLVLCLILAVSAVCAGTVGAFAATGDTVYCRLNNGWSKVYCYMWSDSIGNNQAWPGVEMTSVEGDVYSYSVSGEYDMIIFNNGSGGNGNQTSDMSYAGNGKLYDLATGKWETYVEIPTSATTPTGTTTATEATTATTPSGDGITVYFKNTDNWSTVNCYMWNSEGDKVAAWPGKAMTDIGGGVWMFSASKTYANCIFNNGSTQTDDLVAKNGYIFDFSKNAWEVYDTSPLQVTEFSADPTTGVYVGSDVTLKATARNTSGATVYYQFSVTNATGGTSVVSNFSSANSVVWTPTTAGTYTINFDFKDSDGNENSRTSTITVEDDSALVKPVIKGVSPANFNLIKVGSATNVSVKAGGGKTGTNLLFYKYIVTDPNGVKNVPYYTLNSTYSFTPTMAGKYSVNVYVQGSDNTTVNKTYEYTATGEDITVPTTVQPTTVQPTTAQPTTVQPTTAEPTTVQPTTAEPTTNPDVLVGDADNDGRLSVKDATFIQKFCVQLETNLTLEIGDVDGDGRISVKDATKLQMIIAQ